MSEPMSAERFDEIRERAKKAKENYQAVRKNDELYEILDIDIPRLLFDTARMYGENAELRTALDLERKGDPLSAEVERLREALKGAMVVAETAKGLTAEVERLREENEVMIIGGYNDTLRVQSRRTYKKLRAENARLRAELEAAKRDLHDVSDIYKFCDKCKYHMGEGVDTCTHPERFSCDAENFYEWRGVCPANCGEQGAPFDEPIPGIGSEKPSH